MTEQWRTRLHGVVYYSIVRKPRTLRELVSDMPGEEWSMRDISGALLDLREAGLLRFLDGAWRSGAERGMVRMGPALSMGHDGGWDHWPGSYRQPDQSDAAHGGIGGPSR